MPNGDPRLQVFSRCFALFGGVVFVASLLYFAWQYAIGFDTAVSLSVPFSPVAWDAAIFSIFALHLRLDLQSAFHRRVRLVARGPAQRMDGVWRRGHADERGTDRRRSARRR